MKLHRETVSTLRKLTSIHCICYENIMDDVVDSHKNTLQVFNVKYLQESHEQNSKKDELNFPTSKVL